MIDIFTKLFATSRRAREERFASALRRLDKNFTALVSVEEHFLTYRTGDGFAHRKPYKDGPRGLVVHGLTPLTHVISNPRSLKQLFASTRQKAKSLKGAG